MKNTVSLLLLLLLTTIGYSQNNQPIPIRVALFAWMPDMALAFEQIEQDFEEKYPQYNLELEPIDPYSEESYGIYKGIDAFYDFDVVEIDYYRFRDVARVHPPSLDAIPSTFIAPNDYVGAATKIRQDDLPFFVPHWICSNNLVVRTTNQQLVRAQSFEAILKALHPKKTPLNVDFYGKATLGEYYADAVLDSYGPEEARKHLEALGNDINTTLKPDIVKKIHQLAEKINPTFRTQLKQYHDFSYLYPEDFYGNNKAALLGYSERLFYVEQAKKEKELIAWSVVQLEAEQYEIKQFPFAQTSQGSPAWVDGFVIPAGKAQYKKEAITTFLTYITTASTYQVFHKKEKHLPARYLLPAYQSAFEAIGQESPLILKYKQLQDDAFLIDNVSLYNGIRKAGKQLSGELSAD